MNNDIEMLFENWFKSVYAWEMKRGVHLRKGEDGKYLHELAEKHFMSFSAALKIAGVIQ